MRQTSDEIDAALDELDMAGPFLFARGGRDGRLSAAVILAGRGAAQPAIEVPGGEAGAARLVYDRFGWRIWQSEIVLPAGSGMAHYVCNGTRHEVVPFAEGDQRIAYVSCNGREKGEETWEPEARNALWSRLADEHAREPFALILHGGDQLYADGVLEAHPAIAEWRRADDATRMTMPVTPEISEAAERDFLRRYLALLAHPAAARLGAEVPSVMMWDDHDIFDGWGSHPPSVQESPIGQAVFEAARRMFQIFQLGRAPQDAMPAGGFGHAVRLPGLSIIAPDLRSTRTKTRVMDEDGWRALGRMLAATAPGEHLLLMSSVPALGPRLSLIERLLNVLPRAQKYEDDLRDQWQSRAHRASWQRLLRMLETTVDERGTPVTVVSGEIHLATRAEMRLGSGRILSQLVASGIAHPPPPRGWARALGLLGWFGEAPLDGRPISIRPLPGQRATYIAERNYLVLSRRGSGWQAEWELEGSGRTAPLAL